MRLRKPSPATVIALTALVVALGGVGYAAIPDSNGTINACYQKRNGDLRVVDLANDCRGSERALAWNQQGGGAIQRTKFSVLSVGASETLGSRGPFTFIHDCDIDHFNHTRSSVRVSTTKEGSRTSFFHGRAGEFGPNTPTFVARWSTTGLGSSNASVATPDGDVVNVLFSIGSDVLGADCVVTADLL